MSTFLTPSSSAFKKKSLPKQDYMSRVMGYGMTAIIMLTGYALDYFDSRVILIVFICLIYPHLVYILSSPFRKRHHQATRKFLIHFDAILCGVLLGYIHVSIELAVLFLIMINTSFIIVGSLSYWIFCIISLPLALRLAYSYLVTRLLARFLPFYLLLPPLVLVYIFRLLHLMLTARLAT